jgi:hypothetical protein
MLWDWWNCSSGRAPANKHEALSSSPVLKEKWVKNLNRHLSKEATLLLRIRNDSATLESSLEILKHFKIELLYDLEVPSLDIYSKDLKSGP